VDLGLNLFVALLTKVPQKKRKHDEIKEFTKSATPSVTKRKAGGELLDSYNSTQHNLSTSPVQLEGALCYPNDEEIDQHALLLLSIGEEARNSSRQPSPIEHEELSSSPSGRVEQPSACKPPKKKIKRQRTTQDQLCVLETTYKTDTMPNLELLEQLAHDLIMTPRRVRIWFQNKRAKMKRTSPHPPTL